MRLYIRHETNYLYTTPQSYTIQQLRLTPRAEPHQRILNWHISMSGKRNEFVDAYDNLSHMLTLTGPHRQVRIIASGSVEVTPLDRGRLTKTESLSPLVFTVPTRLSETDEAIVEFANSHLRPKAKSTQLLELAAAIRSTVAYQTGATIVTTPAADALKLGRGVCQDHAHLFIACCRTQGIPARYVSGYVDAGGTDHAESHAWVDVWVEEESFTGWISIDVTHAIFASDMHCRLAVGRDYESAAPIRGMRQGGGDESMTVRVDVKPQ